MADHSASGLEHATQCLIKTAPYSDSLSLRYPPRVNLEHTANSQVILQKAAQSRDAEQARHPTLDGCRHTVSGYYFTPLPRYFSPFPHGTIRYRSPGNKASGCPARFTQDFSGLCYLGNLQESRTISATGVLPLRRTFRIVLRLPIRFLTLRPAGRQSRTPRPVSATPAGYHTPTV